METEFTPVLSLLGGVLIGCAAVLLMLIHGRIAGATGILAGFVLPSGLSEWGWRAAMIAGMATAPAVVLLATGTMPVVDVPVSVMALTGGGLLVGIGVTLGGGCTSGHGVCGLARLSPRSLVATLTFMAACFATVYTVRHVLGG
ncbi:MAG: YeeE/YedE family protein [Pseudomonadota bacterium]